jgi:serine/threonine-protein kinase
MAPEQFHGTDPTDATDIYALGVVTYEMLSGRLPFDAPSTAGLMQKILTSAVPPLESTVPDEVQAVVMRLLSRDPAGRPCSAAEAARILRESIGAERASVPMPVTRPLAASGNELAATVPMAEALPRTSESPAVPPVVRSVAAPSTYSLPVTAGTRWTRRIVVLIAVGLAAGLVIVALQLARTPPTDAVPVPAVAVPAPVEPPVLPAAHRAPPSLPAVGPLPVSPDAGLPVGDPPPAVAPVTATPHRPRPPRGKAGAVWNGEVIDE